MPEYVTVDWSKRGRPSQEKIEATAAEIRAGRVMPDGKPVPPSVLRFMSLADGTPVVAEGIHRAVAAAVTQARETVPQEAEKSTPKRHRRTNVEIERDAANLRIEQSREMDDSPLTGPDHVIIKAIENYREFCAWVEAGKVPETSHSYVYACAQYARIPAEVKKRFGAG